MKIKICTICKEELAIDKFGKEKYGKYGIASQCKECKKEYRKLYLEKNKVAIAERSKKYWQDNKEKFAENAKQYRQDNKEALAERGRIYRQNHDRSEQQKEYRLKTKAGKAKKCKQWWLDNRDAQLVKKKIYYEANKEIIALRNDLYRKKNIEKSRMRCQSYRSRKSQLPTTLSNEQWMTAKQHFDNGCAYCGNELPLAQDHFIPLSKGGEYTHNNIIPACGVCNSSKSNKDFLEWYRQQQFYSKKRETKVLKYLNYKNGIQQLALM